MPLRDWLPSSSTAAQLLGATVVVGGLTVGSLLYYFQLALIYPANVPQGQPRPRPSSNSLTR